MFHHLCLGETFDWAPVRQTVAMLGCGWWSRCGRREAWYGRQQDALLLKTHRWCGGERALVAQLQLAGEAHGDGEGLRVVDFHVEAEGWLESRGEDLNLLCLR